jgi:hypothetical protein
MRRVAAVFLIGFLVPVLGVAAPVSAQTRRSAAGYAPEYGPSPSPSPGDGTPTPALGEPVCTIEDHQMTELSGLVATSDGYVVINDSNSNGDAIKIFFLDGSCKRKNVIGYPTKVRDPEDLAIQADGTILAADIGDNLLTPSRPNIALWKLPPGGGTNKMTVFRFQYPDGAHDCEALLLTKDGSPIFVTKAINGPAGVYVPEAALDPSGKAVPLKKVGQFQPQRTGTENPMGVNGQNMVTGGANSPDGRKVVLRTYSDAYEWDVPDGDVVRAITAGKPRITPLPREPFGEAIAYTPDGSEFLTVSDRNEPVKILRYKPATGAPAAAAKVPGAAPPKKAANRSWLDNLSLRQITYLVAGVGLLGLLFVLIGVVGIRRSRQERRLAALGTVRGTAAVGTGSSGRSADGYDDDPDAGQGGTVYGGSTYSGGTYGGGTYGGGTYGGPDYDGYDSGYETPGYGSQGYDGYDPRSDYTPRR